MVLNLNLNYGDMTIIKLVVAIKKLLRLYLLVMFRSVLQMHSSEAISYTCESFVAVKLMLQVAGFTCRVILGTRVYESCGVHTNLNLTLTLTECYAMRHSHLRLDDIGASSSRRCDVVFVSSSAPGSRFTNR